MGVTVMFLAVVLAFEVPKFFEDVYKVPLENKNGLIITTAEFDERVNNDEKLVIMDGMVLNVAEFLEYHPGGQFVINKRMGYDITDLFYGKPYSGESEVGANEEGHMHSV